MTIKVETTGRGFQFAEFEDYNRQLCSIQQSSAIDQTKEGDFEHPGSSLLWLGVLGARMHLNTNQVKDLIEQMTFWLENGVLKET